MKHICIAVAASFALSGAALAQSAAASNTPPASTSTMNAPPTSTSAAPPAVATGQGDSNTAAAPVPGKNSFTEAQARHRLRKHGYSHVNGLKLDDQGIWRGTATKAGKSIDVSVDYQGNVVGQ